MLNLTAGGRHAWYEAEHKGVIFKVKKPIGEVDLSVAPTPEPVEMSLSGAAAVPTVEKAATIAWPFWTRLLIKLGLRSNCCGAKTRYHKGYDQTYCTGCDKRIS